MGFTWRLFTILQIKKEGILFGGQALSLNCGSLELMIIMIILLYKQLMSIWLTLIPSVFLLKVKSFIILLLLLAFLS